MRLRILPLMCLTVIISLVVMAAEEGSKREGLRNLVLRASQGDAKSLYDLAVLHDTGYDSIPVDSARSTMLYRLSAEKGYAPAQNYLGFRYYNGEYVKRDLDSALFWLAKAAGNGDIKAAGNLGYLLSHSYDVTRDYPQAVMWLNLASDAGLPTAQSLLADLTRQGLGTQIDTVRAMNLYTLAIEGGLQDAELKLLAMMGRKWENLSPDSALNLGRYYYTHRAPLTGVTLFEISEKGGNAEAMTLLGDAYSRAIGVEYDHDKSLQYFLKGALSGNPSAQFIIGELLDLFPDAFNDSAISLVLNDFYNSTDSIPEEIFNAQYWYEKAASQGIDNAETAYMKLLDY